jgi:mono/diheme cytochrome c family protein
VYLKFILSAAAVLVVAASAPKTVRAAESGAALFAENCAACHQPQGQGIPGAFPALAGNKLVAGDPKVPAWILTHGRGGMPNFSEDLSDAQMAEVLTFIRGSWGNGASAVDVATVAGERGAPAPPDTGAGLPFH